MPPDPVLHQFLSVQREEAARLAALPGLVRILGADQRHDPPRTYLVHFSTRGLARIDGEIREHSSWLCRVSFGERHLREVDPGTVLLVEDVEAWHPNIRRPFICLGFLQPGVELAEILLQVHAVIGYSNYVLHEGLNEAARDWAAAHADRFPLDPRPLWSPEAESCHTQGLAGVVEIEEEPA